MRNSIFYSALTDENGNILVDENGNKLLAEIGITDTEVFQNLTQAYMPKNEKIIKDIIIQIDDDITVEQLSEGEKKLILVKTVLEILSDEKTLVLMDEPDAHLHEGRKPALCNMMREYPNRQIVIATHSPIMAQIANEKELLMLELENGKSTILTDEKIEKIKKLSGTSWDVIGQGMMLRSSRPLVVFEGKTDVMYVNKGASCMNTQKLNSAIAEFTKKKKSNAAYYEENWAERKERKEYYQSFLSFACAGSLDGKPHGYPFASAAAIDLQVKNRIVKTAFLLQAACYHNALLFYNR